jgi:hypothetical protein
MAADLLLCEVIAMAPNVATDRLATNRIARFEFFFIYRLFLVPRFNKTRVLDHGDLRIEEKNFRDC